MPVPKVIKTPDPNCTPCAERARQRALALAGLHLHHSAQGIGDAICGLYAACGAADFDPSRPVVYHTKHPAWLQRASHPNVTIAPDAVSGVDFYAGYNKSLGSGIGRKQWYCNLIDPGIKPVSPQTIDTSIHNRWIDALRYVVLSPFSVYRGREWSMTHWRYLCHLLNQEGILPVAIGGGDDSARLQEVFGGTAAHWFYGQSPQWLADAILGSLAFVGNDSGMAHYAALLRHKTIAIHAQLEPGVLWEATEVKSLCPTTSCVFCHFDGKRGYAIACDSGCSALASVTPDAAMSAIKECIND